MNATTEQPKVKVQICIIAPYNGFAAAISLAYAQELNIDPDGGIAEVARVLDLLDPQRIIALRWPDDSWSDTDGGPIEAGLEAGLEGWYQATRNPLASMPVGGNA